MIHLGSTAARLKLKGIDGGPHKRRSMWFNSMIREEPYQGLKVSEVCGNMYVSNDTKLGAAWLSSARAVRCWVKSRNERNPYFQLPTRNGGNSGETAAVRREEGGDDVRSSWPLCPGLHTCYNGEDKGKLPGDRMQISKTSSQFRL